MKKILSVAVLSTVLSSSLWTFAGTNTPAVDQRQERQDKRIDQGASSGQLTDKEQKNLEKGQEHVENLEDKAKADGVVTRRERRRLHHAQNVQSRKIYNKKHNNRTE